MPIVPFVTGLQVLMDLLNLPSSQGCQTEVAKIAARFVDQAIAPEQHNSSKASTDDFGGRRDRTVAILARYAAGDDSMKLLNHWLRLLSAGLVTWVTVNSLHAQGLPHRHGPDCAGDHEATCAAPDGCDSSSCDGGCDGSCGRGGGLLGGGMGGRGMGDGGMGGPGLFGGPGLMGGMGGDHSVFGACRGCGVFGPCSPGGICGTCGPMGGLAGGGGLGGDMMDCNQFGEANSDPMCPRCGYQGCFRCGWGLGLLASSKMGNMAKHLLPYGEGGVSTPRWFDLSAEAVILKRDSGPGNFNYSSLGAGSNNFVLTNNSVDMGQYRAGLGLQGNLQLGVATSLEGVYFGLNRWSRSATANDNPNGAANLYSFISAFGLDPLNGFDDSDRSLTHSLTYESRLNNGEFNLRRRWAGQYRWFQGSWLMGMRYLSLDENLLFAARGENNNGAANNGPRFFNYNTAATNSLTAFQVGADLWMNVIPGVKIGTEAKFGVGGNTATQTTTINANSLNNFVEKITDGREAYIASLSIPLVYKITYGVALRGSYQMLYIDNLALAADNFNNVPPALILPGSIRNVRINNDAEVLYTGFTAGAEFTW